MGILGLNKLIADLAPQSIKNYDIKNYFGRKIAIDASMSLYQFLIAVRSDGSQLTNSNGEVTSHLLGMFYRTIRLVENGLKPVYIFDGKPPKLKGAELEKRADRRDEAEKSLKAAEETGDAEQVNKFSRRLVKVTKDHVEDCKRLLNAMGIPYFEAPCEAEAQCAALVKAGKVYATATEDMDALTFGSKILIKHLTFSEARKMPIQEIHLDVFLNELNLTQAEFIDLCILMGCDYCDTIKGVGPKRAIELIKKHKSLEKIIENLDPKYSPPENWNFKQVRECFCNPVVAEPDTIQLKWSEPNIDELVDFLCKEKMFNEDRVRNGAKKLLKAKTELTQGRLDNFFKALPSASQKRPVEEKEKSNKKAKKGAGKGQKKPK